MSLPTEIDDLVLQLASSLPPDRYDGFVDAARTTLAGIPCIGPGSAYRALVSLQARYFTPPPDPRIAAGPKHYRAGSTKLAVLPPIAIEDARSIGRRRALWARR
jgi:hypothetical protein